MQDNFFRNTTIQGFIFIVLSLVSACKKDKQLNPDFVPSGYNLVWEDDFNGTTLDTSKWNYRDLGLRYNGYNTKDAISLDGKGNLLIKTFIRHDTVFTGMIGTQGLFQAKYGYFVCRAKLQSTTGNRTAFWLQSPEISMGASSEEYGTEVDVYEYIFNNNRVISSNLHWGGYTSTEQSSGPFYYGTVDGYNTFGVLWNSSGYTFYVNGVNIGSSNKGVSNVSEYMILSSEFEPNNTTVENFPNVLTVDYIKVYQ